MGATTARDDLLFGVRRSIRYHLRRYQFLDKTHKISMLLAAVSGSATIATLLSNAVDQQYVIMCASIVAITSLITKDFIKLILLGIVIGVPIAWYFMNKWLANYEYRIDMPWWAFVTTSVLIICFSLFTISFESIKAALSNPIKSLETE